MTQLEKEALVLFKEYTHLQLKSFLIHLTSGAGGATENYELNLLNKALEYHSEYIKIKLDVKSNSSLKNNIKETKD